MNIKTTRKSTHNAPETSLKSVRFGLNSIGTRLFLAVMAAATIGLGGLGTLFYRELESAKLIQLTIETNVKVRELDAELRRSEGFLKSLVAATTFLHESGVRDPAVYEKLVLAFMPARPALITGFGIMQRPQGLVDRPWFGPYIEESQPNRGIKVPEAPQFSLVDLWPVDHYPKLQYYTDAVKENRYFWSNPYINASYPVPLMTFAGPIRDRQGRLIAIMNGDINIRDLSQSRDLPASGTMGASDTMEYDALLTRQGKLLSYSLDPSKAAKLENISSIPELQGAWEQIQRELARGKSQGYLKFAQTDTYWVYQLVPSNQWVMLHAISARSVMQPALVGALSATLVAGIILAFVVIWFVRWLNQRLQPILEICDTTLSAEEGSLSPRDEIDHVSQAVFRMVQQQNALLQELQAANTQLIQSNQLKDSFLSTINHELRTPLNSILGMTEGLRSQVFGTANGLQLQALQTIERNGNHLLELIGDILDMSEIETRQIALRRVSIPLSHLCESSLAVIQQSAGRKNIQLELKLPPQMPDLHVDERRIRQALVNLLNNAVKFTPEGGCITLEVTRLDPPGSPQDIAWIRFSVIDTGIGIAPENISRLFQPFSQLDQTFNRRYAGTGLGLALVKRIVELHGGQVGVTSELGAGSCFTIALPEPSGVYGGAIATPSISPPSLAAPTTNAVAKQAPLILLAGEGNEANHMTISSYLRAKGYSLLLAQSGPAAISLAQDHQPDVVLMDVQIPDLDGLETMRQMRLDPSLVDMPIIVLTTLATMVDRDRCLEAGATDCLAKPLKLQQLFGIIQKLVDSRRDAACTGESDSDRP